LKKKITLDRRGAREDVAELQEAQSRKKKAERRRSALKMRPATVAALFELINIDID